MIKMSDYFLISVSNKHNLDLCMKYALAGFTNSINGLWTFLDIDEGDHVSFLYGARVYNLYRVVKKEAYRNAETLPPWPPVTFRESGKTYYFPFRLQLKQIRRVNELIARPEFTYVAENLLLRGGYRKTHFQADTVTFYNVSNMGAIYKNGNQRLAVEGETFTPKIVFKQDKQGIPEKFYFRELILQSIVRKKMKGSLLRIILDHFGVNLSDNDFEVLGEKALPRGFVDVFIKLKHPRGSNIYFLVEIKTGKAQLKDLEQLSSYMQEFGDECKGGILIARDFPKRNFAMNNPNILLIKYRFEGIDKDGEYTYDQLLQKLNLDL